MDIWGDRFPVEEPQAHTLIEKLLLTPPLILRCFSLSNLTALLVPAGGSNYVHIDLYVILWAVFLSFLLLSGPYRPIWGVIVFYRIVDIITYHLCILLVDSQKPNWRLKSTRRSYLFVGINLYELTIAFALLFLLLGNVANDSNRLDTPMEALYYSLVTMATLGYGDFVPIDNAARCLVIVQLATEILFVVAVAPVVVSTLTDELASKQHKNSQKRE